MVDAEERHAVEEARDGDRGAGRAGGEADAGAGQVPEDEEDEGGEVEVVEDPHRLDRRQQQIREHHRRIERGGLRHAEQREAAELVRVPEREVAGAQRLGDVALLGEERDVEVLPVHARPEAAAPRREASGRRGHHAGDGE